MARGRPSRAAAAASPMAAAATAASKTKKTKGGGGGGGGKQQQRRRRNQPAVGGGRGTSSFPSSSMTTGRTWIYHIGSTTTTATSDNGDDLNFGGDDDYENVVGTAATVARQYLGRRIAHRLPVVRSLHTGYSYFQNKNDDDDDDDDTTTKKMTVVGEGGNGVDVVVGAMDDTTLSANATATATATATVAVAVATTGEGDEDGVGGTGGGNGDDNNDKDELLEFVYIPLPPPLEQSMITATDTTTTSGSGEKGIPILSYSDFVSSTSTTTSSSASSSSSSANINYKHGMNYSTHLPGRNVMARVLVGGEAGGASSSSSGYVLRMPMTGGTIIGYSPPPLGSVKDDDDDDDDNDDDDYEEFEEDEEQGIIVVRDDDTALHQQLRLGGGAAGAGAGNAEFPIERQKEDVALVRILWDGHTATSGYVEDMTLSELQSYLAMTTTSVTSSSTSSPPPSTTAASASSSSAKRGQHQKQLQLQQQQQRLHQLQQQQQQKQKEETSYAIARHVHATSTRYTLAFEWKIECSILPHLVLVAALELRKEMGRKVRWELLVERKKKKLLADKQAALGMGEGGGGGVGGATTKKTTSTRGGGGGGGSQGGGEEDEEIVNQHGDAFGYYAKHPHQYMPSFAPPPPPPVDDDEDDDEDEEDDLDGKVKKKKQKSITKLTEAELSLYHSRLESECNFPPSKIAERVRAACAMVYDSMISRGQMDEYYIECDRREECERLEREKMMGEVGRGGGGGSGGGGGGSNSRGSSSGTIPSDILSAAGEVRRSTRPRATVNYAEDSAAAIAAVTTGTESVGAGGRRRGGGGGGGGGSASSTNALLDEKSLLPKETSPGGPTALYLLEMLKMLPKKEMGEEGNGGGGGGNVDAGTKAKVDDDNVDDDSAELDDSDNDPFFEPKACLIVDQLGRKQRYLSPASIQAAIVRGIEDQIDTPEFLLDEEELEEIANDHRHKYVTDLVCTTGDKVSDLGQYEPASFARCRFAPHTFLAETDDNDDDEPDEDDDEDLATAEELEAKERRREQRRLEKKAAYQKRNAELERAYRTQKSFEVWRFRSIHGDGYTIFPLWRDTSRELIKNLCSSGVVGDVSCRGGTEKAEPEIEAIIPAVQPTSDPSVEYPPSAADTQNDEELARVLAAEADFDVLDGDAPLAKRRRTTRLARSSTAATGGIDQVFYGGSMSMSRDQLLDSVLRLLQQASEVSGGSSSLMNLKRIIFPESYESRGGLVEMRKLRAALGHLVYKLGKVRRLFVTVEESDGVCWDMLRHSGPLVKFVGDDDDGIVADSTLKTEAGSQHETNESDTSTKPTTAHSSSVANGDANGSSSSVATTLASSALAPAIDHHLKSQLHSLENYISSLHRTELILRNSLMKAIDKNSDSSNGHGSLLQISTLAIATASDEVEGSTEAEDWKYFLKQGDGMVSDDIIEAGNITWNSDADSHVFLGQVIYRPRFPPLRPSQHDGAEYDARFLNEKCYWYRIVSYTPSIKAAAEVTSEGGNPTSSAIPVLGSMKPIDSTIVERRMRFRAVPVAESDVVGRLDGGVEASVDMRIDDDDSEHVILTEGQAYAGIEAATLWRGMHKKQMKSDVRNSKEITHPFRNRYGSRVMLTPRPKVGDEEDSDEKKFEVLYGVIAGYNIRYDQSASANKLLVLLEDNKGNKVENNEDNAEATMTSGSAFWSTITDDSEGTTFLTDICVSSNCTDNKTVPSSLFCSTYIIALDEFHQGSEAYNVCSSIVAYMKSHPRIGPFLFPVDPVKMQLYQYEKYVPHPMDVSTVEKNLVDGKYSRISPNTTKQIDENAKQGQQDDEAADSPVYRMVYNGGFYDDIMLIFDNCITYNGAESWIGNEATKLRKNIMKKVETLVSKAFWQGPGRGTSRGKGADEGKQFTYAEVDSDEDMYEYESDSEDDRRSKKNRGGAAAGANAKTRDTHTHKRQGGKEDIPSKAIEQQFVVPEHPHEFGTGGAFPHVKVQTNVGKFTLSQELWSCRYRRDEEPVEKSSNENEDGPLSSKKKDEADDDELLLLLQLQQQEDSGGVRRSTRERHAPQNYAEDDAFSSFPSFTTRSSSTIPQSPVSLPGVEYYLINGDVYQPAMATSADDMHIEKSIIQSNSIPTVCRSRLGAEGIQELIHESFYAKLYRDHSPNALILESGIGTYASGSFPPYLGRVISSSSSSFSSSDGDNGGCSSISPSIVWEIREQYLIPALRWIMRGLVRSGHLDEVDGSLSEGALEDAALRSGTSLGSGIVVPNHEYYYNNNNISNKNVRPFDVLDEKEILRKRRQIAAADGSGGGGAETVDEKVELSEYEQMRAARVARNADRLKALGLA